MATDQTTHLRIISSSNTNTCTTFQNDAVMEEVDSRYHQPGNIVSIFSLLILIVVYA